MGVTINARIGWDHLVFVDPDTDEELLSIDVGEAYRILDNQRKDKYVQD